MADDNNFGVVGIECAICKHRVVFRVDYERDELKGRSLPMTGQQCQNCRSATTSVRERHAANLTGCRAMVGFEQEKGIAQPEGDEPSASNRQDDDSRHLEHRGAGYATSVDRNPGSTRLGCDVVEQRAGGIFQKSEIGPGRLCMVEGRCVRRARAKPLAKAFPFLVPQRLSAESNHPFRCFCFDFIPPVPKHAHVSVQRPGFDPS
jgi:hypothetical protein